MSISATLPRLRREAHLTQQQLAVRAGLTVSAIHKLERGICKPSLDSLQALALALNCNLDTLVGIRRKAQVTA